MLKMNNFFVHSNHLYYIGGSYLSTQITLAATFLICSYFIICSLLNATWFEKLINFQSKRYAFYTSENYMYMNDEQY
ncbi:putative membrane protein [Paenibacillus riograndensis SBR5]|uniref:Putative membrane protein n=1 Tax=Paenibacillus riograndensis SBR5 TaxID=1073571 RepID=A0A0E4HA51_9BACL|nr:putative membrane protein [Paenibacillus riograndensis SBR5]